MTRQAKTPGDKGFKFWWHKMATRDGELTAAQYRVLMAVWDYTDEHGRNAFPGRDGIARGSACAPRTVDRTLPVLTAGCYLTVMDEGGRGKGGRGLATVYALGVPTHWQDETPANVTGVSEVSPVDNETGNPRQPDGGIGQETPANESETPAILTETPANESLNPRHDGGPISPLSIPFIKSKDQIRPTSPSPSSPAPVDNFGSLEETEEGEPDTAEAYDVLDKLQANESTPDTPDYLIGLDDDGPLEPTGHDWDEEPQEHEPIGPHQPPAPSNAGRLEIHQEENPNPTQARDDAAALCDYLAARVQANGARPKITPAWTPAARALLDEDGYTPEQVAWIIRWATDDDFWHKVILDMPKLREKFEQLKLKALAKRRPSKRQREVQVFLNATPTPGTTWAPTPPVPAPRAAPIATTQPHRVTTPQPDALTITTDEDVEAERNRQLAALRDKFPDTAA
ncbi:hypothetical protein DEJ38_06550 [Kocuria rosea]|uniref:hypothetical protein n=1 Tax=Kocuria rosea TaxID=1275 RepID=UPI000D656C15|nr:hypothetical protein [Kocuria rosea]PWF82353.1 hypothetical protein DEJ38_06550 [Kocuria rosea]